MKRWLWILIAGGIIGIAVVVLLTNFLYVQVSDNTMLPAYDKGHKILIRHSKPANIQRWDVIAYHSPELADKEISKKPVRVSRLAGLPGDTLTIDNKVVYLNNVRANSPSKRYYKYRLSAHKGFDPKSLEKQPIHYLSEVIDGMAWEFHTTPSDAAAIQRNDEVITVRQLSQLRGQRQEGIFPQSRFFPWNESYFGPLVVPKSGQPVNLNYKNYKMYQRLISVYEGHQMYVNNRKIYLDGEEATTFVPEQDYYFVLDDNRDDGNDSRHMGFIPADHIRGKKTAQHAK